MTNEPLVYIIIVNWNGWIDTIECLESIFRNDYSNYRVIVCDNDSQNNSVEHIKAWSHGKISVWTYPNNPLRYLSYPPVSKSISYLETSRDTLEYTDNTIDREPSLILVHTGDNLGFGRANNIGIQYAFNHNADFVWLVNNDTVIESNAISEMVTTAKMRSGITGSILKYYSQPSEIQVYGGGYLFRYTGRIKPEQKFQPTHLNFITGASFMIDRYTFDKLEGFDENIFMYFEDIDYCIRANQAKIAMTCSNAVVFHKIGASSNGDNSYFAWINGYKNKAYSLKKNYGLGIWFLFYILILFINIINPTTPKNKRKASIQIFLDLIKVS